MSAPNRPNTMAVGSTGSGKSFSAAYDLLTFPGSAVVLDPHKHSIAELVLEHSAGRNVLYDRLDDPRFALAYGLLNPSPDYEANLVEAEIIVEIMLRQQQADSLAGAPLKAEWLHAAIMIFLTQGGPPKDPSIVPFAFLPGTPEFDSLVRDTTRGELRHKFSQLEKLTPRGLRNEVGSAARITDGSFKSDAFIRRCRRGRFDLGRFLQTPGSRLILEAGDASDEVTRLVFGGVMTRVREFCEGRKSLYPPIEIIPDEVNNKKLFARREQQALAETRKYGLTWKPMTQFLNFPGGPEAVLQNCVRKEIYGTADQSLAVQLAQIVEPGWPETTVTVKRKTGDEERDSRKAERVEMLTKLIRGLQPGQRVVSDREGSRMETLPMLPELWPDWPDLRAKKLEELKWRILARPEYGESSAPASRTSPPATPSPPTSSPPPFSPAERWRRGARRPPASS